jgi:hypothetical protein
LRTPAYEGKPDFTESLAERKLSKRIVAGGLHGPGQRGWRRRFVSSGVHIESSESGCATPHL